MTEQKASRALPLSPAAASELTRLNGTHERRLQQMASSAARAKNADMVSKSDIIFAANSMGVNAAKKRYKIASDVSAGFIGAALAGIVAMVIARSYTFNTAVAVGIPLLIGISLYIYGLRGQS